MTWFPIACLAACALVIEAFCRGLAAAVRCVATALGLPLTTDRTKEGS